MPAVKPLLVLGAATFLSAGCGPTADRSAPITERDSAGVTIVENDIARLDAVCPVSAAPEVVIGSAAGGEAYELYRVFGARRLSDGRIVLVNQGSQELRFYDADGKFLRAAGRAGRGPGEFSDAFHLWVLPGDTIWVGDYPPWQFLVFSPEGEWVRTVRPTPEYVNNPQVMDVLDDGRSMLADPGFHPRTTTFEMSHATPVLHAPDGALLDTIATLPDGRWGKLDDDPRSPGMSPLFESFARVAAAGSRVVIGHGATPELRVLDADLDIARIVRWTAAVDPVGSEDVAAERERIAEPYADMEPAMRQRFLDPFISADRPVAETFPVFSGLRIGRDGRIWVRSYVRPRGPETEEWLAFDADGRFACRATIPPVDQVLEFGADYMLAHDPDELGVERVVLYAIGEAGPTIADRQPLRRRGSASPVRRPSARDGLTAAAGLGSSPRSR